MDILLTHESTIRLSVFAGLFLVMAVLEAIKPRRKGRSYALPEMVFKSRYPVCGRAVCALPAAMGAR